MIEKKYLVLIIFTIIINFSVNITNTNYEKKLVKSQQEIDKLENQIELIEINWTYIIRPENLKRINNKSFELEPITLNDLIDQNPLGN